MLLGVKRRTPLCITLSLLACLIAVSGSLAPAQQVRDARAELDRYGGYRAISARATGFFRVDRIDGRWWFVTPDGHAFLSAGVNHVDYQGDYSGAFVRFVVSHLQDWGFNTIGWTQELTGRDPLDGRMVHSPGWGPPQYRQAHMPYTHLIRFTDIEWYVEERFPDVFSEDFAGKCDRLAREVCPKLRDDPYLIGYFYADTPNWPLWAECVARDKLSDVAVQYYRVIHDAIRRYDPNHLLLGDRYKGDRVIPVGREKVNGLPEAVLDAMKETVDVLSVEYYRPGDRFEEDLQEWHARTGKPILLADSAYLAPTDVLKPSPGSPVYVPDQAARGEAYRAFARRAYSNPLVVGWHWCAFGRSSERKSGLLDGDDQPYQQCVDRMRQFNTTELYATASRNLRQLGNAIEPSAPQDRQPGPTAPDEAQPDPSRDRYGGTTLVKTEASGYFQVKPVDGRWWLITPEGHGFISIGINHLDLAALKYPDNIHIFRHRYGSSTDRFIQEGIAKPLRQWGFNTIGWTQELVGGRWGKPNSVLRHSPEWSHRQFQLAGLPYVYNLKFADIENFNAVPLYPDVFSEDFSQWADYLARSACVDMATEPLLVGYADVPVPAITADRPGSWAEGLDLEDPADRRRLEEIVRRYFQVTTAAIRRYDPNHLIFGPRFGRPADTPDWVIELAGEYFDVILSNRFLTPQQVAEELARWHRLSGRPVLISDQAYLAPTHILKVGPTAPSYVPDQEARGEAYRRFAECSLQLPFIVGIHWCAFMENRTRKSGLKNYLDEPYWDCVRPMQEFNLHRLYPTALGR